MRLYRVPVHVPYSVKGGEAKDNSGNSTLRLLVGSGLVIPHWRPWADQETEGAIRWIEQQKVAHTSVI